VKRIGVAAVGRNCARASCTSWCGDTRALCAQQWFSWVTNVFDYRSNGAALCCALIHQHWWTHPLSIVVTCALVVAEPCAWAGARRVARCNWFEIDSVWSVLHRRVYSAVHGCALAARRCRFRLRQEVRTGCASFQTTAVSCLQRESWHCGYARVMDVLLGLMHWWRWSGEPYIPVCPSVGKNLGELSAGDLTQQEFRGVRGCTSTSMAFYVKVPVPMRLPDAGRLPRTKTVNGTATL